MFDILRNRHSEKQTNLAYPEEVLDRVHAFAKPFPNAKPFPRDCELDRELTLRTFSTGSMHLRNMSMHSSSNLARVMLVLKSTPSNRLSISMVVCAEALRVRFARSQAVLRRRTALGLPEMSFLFLRLNSCRQI